MWRARVEEHPGRGPAFDHGSNKDSISHEPRFNKLPGSSRLRRCWTRGRQRFKRSLPILARFQDNPLPIRVDGHDEPLQERPAHKAIVESACGLSRGGLCDRHFIKLQAPNPHIPQRAIPGGRSSHRESSAHGLIEPLSMDAAWGRNSQRHFREDADPLPTNLGGQGHDQARLTGKAGNDCSGREIAEARSDFDRISAKINAHSAACE